MTLALLTLLGCPTSSDDTAGDGDGKQPSFEPAEGNWNGGEYTVKKDSCALFENEDTTTDLDVYVLTLRKSGFDLAVSQDEFTVTWNCSLSGKDFTCPDQVLGLQDFSSDGVDATITVLGAIDGAFSTETAASVDISVNATCDGKDCDMAAGLLGIEFPCVAELTQPVTHE